MLEYSFRWYSDALCRAVLKQTHAKSNRSQSDHLRRDCSFAGRTLGEGARQRLAQLRTPSHSPPFLHTLGEYEVKHGVRIDVANLFGLEKRIHASIGALGGATPGEGLVELRRQSISNR